MATLNTLNSLIDDILLTIRNSNVSSSEPINRRQIEQWIHYYRARIIKEELEKDSIIDPKYITRLDNVNLLEVNTENNDKDLITPCRYVADVKIPNTIKTKGSNGILSITDSYGNEIQMVSYIRLSRQKHRKYTCDDYLAVLKDSRIYVEGPGHLEYINIALIPEDPNTLDNNCDFADQPYPIPVNKIWLLKQLIFTNELGIMLPKPTDNKNNSKNDLENIYKNE